MSSAPAAAPRTLPMPPTTAATNALRPSSTHELSAVMRRSLRSANRMPPAAASAEPTANVTDTTTLTLMPISDATRSLNATARIARPIFVP